MKFIQLGMILAWLYIVNLAAGALLAKYFPSFSLAKTTTVAITVLVLFFLEHFVGFGHLAWAFPVLFVLALLILSRHREFIGQWLRLDVGFIAGFLYAFYWRYTIPDITASTENLTDLYFIACYTPGTTLPPQNLWLPPFEFDFYYAFQHYAAALLARIFSIGPGYAYNLAFPLIFAYAMGLLWETTWSFTKSKAYSWLLVVVVLIGATGVSAIFPIIKNADAHDNPIIGAMRFVGDAELRTSIAPYFKWESRELQSVPLESFGYTLFASDYHPPLSSYLVLFFFLAALFFWRRQRNNRALIAVMSMSPVLVLLGNVWVFPLIVFAFLGWLIYCYREEIPIDWTTILLAGGTSVALASPFLSYFAFSAPSAPITITPWARHTPLPLLALVFWPTLVCVILALFEKSAGSYRFYFAGTFFVLLAFSEFVYVNDGTLPTYARTNSTMKWWGWIYLFGMIPALWFLYHSKAVWKKGLILIALLWPSFVHGYFLTQHLIPFGKWNIGALQGSAWIEHDKAMGDLLKYLQRAPDGITLEYIEKDAFTEPPALSIYSLKPVFVSWPHHLASTWHKSAGIVMGRVSRMREFYTGKLAERQKWALENHITYIIWSNRERDLEQFKLLNQELSQHYTWKGFNEEGRAPVGVWVRR